MLVIYTSPGCASCRKAKQWLKDHSIAFVEKNIFSTLLKESEIRFLLQRSENGSDDLISKRSKIIKDNHVDIDSMNVKELIGFIQKNPSILKRPIILDENNILVGFNAEEIEVFDRGNHSYRIKCSGISCPNYEVCGQLRGDE